jgi:hypothetical protein
VIDDVALSAEQDGQPLIASPEALSRKFLEPIAQRRAGAAAPARRPARPAHVDQPARTANADVIGGSQLRDNHGRARCRFPEDADDLLLGKPLPSPESSCPKPSCGLKT